MISDAAEAVFSPASTRFIVVLWLDVYKAQMLNDNP